MPITMGAFALASMGLVGMPPIGGFISKWFLGQGAVDAGREVFLGVLLLSGLLNAGYFFPIVRRAFFVHSDVFTRFDEAPSLVVVPLALAALLALFLGLMPDGVFRFYELAADVAMSVMSGGAR